MASARTYQQFCPTAAALNVVGERWALLVVRDLMLGPRRFSELLHGLGGVATDVLTTRLRDLEAAGVVRRRGAGRAQRYELTATGRRLQPVLVELGRWGAERLQLPRDPDDLRPRVLLTSLVLDAPRLPPGASGIFELRCGQEAARVEVRDGTLAITPDADPPTVVELTGMGLRGLLMGAPVRDLRASGDIAIRGDVRAATALLTALSAPALLDGLRRQATG